MQISFKTSLLFLAATGISTALLLQPAAAQSNANPTPAQIDMAQRKAAASQRRAELKAQLDADQAKLEAAAGKSPGQAANMQKKSGSGSFDLEARRKEREAMRKAQKEELKKRQQNLAARRIHTRASYEEQPRAAPRYIQEYLDAIKALKKKHEPYTLPPPRK